jgi:hypothetical protein
MGYALHMKLRPQQIYSARELLALGVFGVKDMKTATRRIVEDKLQKKPLLDAEIRGEGRMRRYYIQGSRAMAYIKANNK